MKKLNLNKGAVDVSATLPRQPNRSYKKRKLSKIKTIVVHTTDMNVSLDELVQFDILPRPDHHISKRGTPAITYHDVVMRGTQNSPHNKYKVFHTLDFSEISWHAQGYNSESIAIAMMYKATGLAIDGKQRDIYVPDRDLVNTTIKRVSRLCLFFGLTPSAVKGHRELKGTGWFWSKGHKRLRKTCPGKSVNMDKFRKSVARKMQAFLSVLGFYNAPIDGIWGSVSNSALEKFRESKV